jgi:hypothetical protein
MSMAVRDYYNGGLSAFERDDGGIYATVKLV